MTPLALTASLLAPQRFGLLLPWINGESLRDADIRERLFSFLEPAAGVFAADVDERGRIRTALPTVNAELFGKQYARPKVQPISAARLERLRNELRELLNGDVRLRQLTSLRFALFKDRQNGAYVVGVDGRLCDLVVYQVMRLLTVPSSVVLAQCQAPAPGDWKKRCGNWLVTGGDRRGRRRLYCSGACRVRAFAKAENENLRDARRRK